MHILIRMHTKDTFIISYGTLGCYLQKGDYCFMGLEMVRETDVENQTCPHYRTC